VEGGKQARHRDRLVDAREYSIEEILVEADRLRVLGLDVMRCIASSFHRIHAAGRFRRKHDCVGAVEHRVGDVGDLARVGTGLATIDSIICVAVMVSLLFSRARRIMRFCSAGTAASPTSPGRPAPP
jgi:hypothetical protein